MLLTIAMAVGILGTDTTAAQQITIDTVTVGNVGNPNDTTGFGSVAHKFNIGRTEVNLSQYTTFLNSVAATDPYGLYNPFMATDANSRGISRSGIDGSFSYSVIGSGNRPVTYVSWFDAARFANWMSNGQPIGLPGNSTTEDGAYSLFGAISGVGFAKNAINPNTGATTTWWIPNENEWYKAAFYDPSASGPSGDYWLFPTRSNDVPGNFIGPFPNNANHRSDATGIYSVTGSVIYSPSDNYLSEGGAFTGSASYYGTFDQGGNVTEWNDSVAGPFMLTRGGSWFDLHIPMESGVGIFQAPTLENSELGFRVATVPEPSAAALLFSGAFVYWMFRRRKLSL